MFEKRYVHDPRWTYDLNEPATHVLNIGIPFAVEATLLDILSRQPHGEAFWYSGAFWDNRDDEESVVLQLLSEWLCEDVVVDALF
jgi:hypothetical protein